MNKYGRLPNLDEIPNVDSSQHIINKLHLDSNSSTSIDNIMSSTNTSSIEEANVSLNDTYKDKDINEQRNVQHILILQYYFYR